MPGPYDSYCKKVNGVNTYDLFARQVVRAKTRSGKIMRRTLRKIAANEIDSLGDTAILASPSVLDHLIEHRENR